VSQSLREQTAALDEARTALMLGLPVALVLATAGGYALARKSLSPVDAMAAHAASIGAGTLHERLPAPRADDELGRLAAVFNSLLERLDQSFQRQRQFMADASHELRTPVAIVRGEAELALSRPERAEADYRAALRTVGHEARRLSQIVNDLFLLARAEAGERQLHRSSLYLEELVGDCVASVRTLAAERRITLCYSPEAELPFTGDDKLLRRLVVNLLDNAIKYTPEGGRVDVDLSGPGDGVPGARITVRDTGRGIPDADRERVFERFYRVRDAATDGGLGDGSGAGLGLPIAAWVAQAHGGTLRIEESGPGGTTFVAELPTSPS
jgi:heavy metal sensor kinase